MAKILHSADWQLGMTRHFLSEEAQPRFSQARFDAIRRLGSLAREAGCECLVVCGDVFESNQVDRRTVARALEALASVPVPVYLLPGNHDPLDAAAVWRATAFATAAPAHVHVVADASPITVRPGLELVGAPWTSRRPLRDLVAAALAPLAPAPPGVTRIGVGHGGVAAFSGNPDDPALVDVPAAERALADGRIHYLALGDRHSPTRVGASGRIWYSGAPEPTDYDEDPQGHALVVDVTPEAVHVTPHAVGAWRFVEREGVDLLGEPDVEALVAWLRACADKERTIVKLRLEGSLDLRARARLDTALDEQRHVFAAIETREDRLVLEPRDGDFAELPLSGFARAALDRLRAEAAAAGPGAAAARDALALLVRLASTPA